MPSTSMRRPGKDRASRSVTCRSGSCGPAAAAVRVAIWRLLYLTDLISDINRTDIRFPGKTPRRTWRDGAGSRTDGHLVGSDGAGVPATPEKRTVGRPSAPAFFFNSTATTEIYTLSLHDALPSPTPRFGGTRSGA